MVGHLLDVLDLLGRVDVEVAGQFLQLFLDDRVRGLRFNGNNFVLEHVEQPLRLNDDPVLHECRLRKVPAEGRHLIDIPAIQRRYSSQIRGEIFIAKQTKHSFANCLFILNSR